MAHRPSRAAGATHPAAARRPIAIGKVECKDKPYLVSAPAVLRTPRGRTKEDPLGQHRDYRDRPDGRVRPWPLRLVPWGRVQHHGRAPHRLPARLPQRDQGRLLVSRPVVYLIHFAQPIGNPASPRGQAGHYLGTAYDLNRRLAQHRAGTGAAIMRAVCERRIPFFVARTWPGGRALERKLKRRKNAPRLCPACVSAPWELPEPEVDELEQAADEAAQQILERALEDRMVGKVAS
jgi:hypothetical protein